MCEFNLIKSIRSLVMKFPSTVDNIDLALKHISEFVVANSKQLDIYGLKVVLAESITNAVIHGNKENDKCFVNLKVVLTNNNLTIRIKDAGPGFDWKKRLTVEDAEDDATSGRGILLIKAYGYNVSYNTKGNIVYLEKELQSL